MQSGGTATVSGLGRRWMRASAGFPVTRCVTLVVAPIVAPVLARVLAAAMAAMMVVAGAARADELVMPFSCEMARGEVKLSPGPETRYALLGDRDEQPFTWCSNGAGSGCTSIMVHRFMTQCAGEKVAWSRIASAGRPLGISVPNNLPAGYAPLSGFRARFVLPALVTFVAARAKVASEALSPDGVIDRNGEGETPPAAASVPWQTIVKAEFRSEASYTALRVAGIAIALLAIMLSACMVAAGRWRLPPAITRELQGILRTVTSDLTHAWAAFAAHFNRLAGRPVADAPKPTCDPAILNAFAIANARLAETELQIATLPRELLLRDVLQSETEGVRRRLATLEEEMLGLAPAKAAGIVRAAIRELERVARIAHGAAQDSGARPRDAFDIPASMHEAYQMLGINADAAPQVAKKLVDALRMSWHPDFARGEEDRQVREARMKQINAAWDLIKERPHAAA